MDIMKYLFKKPVDYDNLFLIYYMKSCLTVQNRVLNKTYI